MFGKPLYLARILQASLIRPHNAGMEKSVFSDEYECFRKKLVEIRTSAKLTQRQLADKMKRERSFVSRIELGERRVDILEFYWICKACGQDPKKVVLEVIAEFDKA